MFVKEKVNSLKFKTTEGNGVERRSVSVLSECLMNNKDTEFDFLLPVPSENDLNSIRVKVFLLQTPQHLELHIAKKSLVNDVIRHIMTLY